MRALRLIFSMKVHDGKLDEFEAVAAAILALVKERGHETVEYEWFLNRELSECMVLEHFANSEALLAHGDMVADLAVRLFSLCDIRSISLCGDASPEVLERTAPFGPTVYPFLQGRG